MMRRDATPVIKRAVLKIRRRCWRTRESGMQKMRGLLTFGRELEKTSMKGLVALRTAVFGLEMRRRWIRQNLKASA